VSTENKPTVGVIQHDPSSNPLERPPLPGIPANPDKAEIVSILGGYRDEAKQNRLGGLNPRDMKWEENCNMYWGRYDHSKKADWQARENMPEVPAFVDRFAAALKEALVGSPSGFYTVTDPADADGDMCQAIKKINDVWLSICGRNQTGALLGFPSVFEEQTKLGAMMGMCSVVTWKGDAREGRVAIDTVDPRQVWLDTTYRNLYRVRRIPIDRSQLLGMSKLKDGKGKPLYDLDELDRMTAFMAADYQYQKGLLTGSQEIVNSTRQEVQLDEYIATVVTGDGRVLADNALMVVANEQFLIRGPERNPFWHGKDWLTFAPLVETPLSVYGRTYMEDFGSVAKTFNELTNLILDATRVAALNAYAVVPGMLRNPKQIANGITPNMVLHLHEGYDARAFAQKLELGQVPAEVIQIWQALKSELREAADINEVGLGQFAPKGRTSATEVGLAQESSSALIRSVAQTVEGRWLDPTLDLVWKTGLQHCKKDDPWMIAAVGQDMWSALWSRRKELIERPITFQARGISMLMQKSRMLKTLLTLLQIVADNDLLMQEFLKVADLGKLVKLLFQLSDVDLRSLQLTEREKLMRSVTEQLAPVQAQAQAQPQAPGAYPAAGAGMAQAMGVAA
jgi:hypothetical protein